MRILMLCPQFRPLVGGYERAAERLSAELVRQGCSVTVIVDRRERTWAKREVVDGFLIWRLFTVHRRRLHSATSLLSHLAFLLWHGRRFDVWHVHQYGAHAALAVAVGKVLRKPVVLKLTGSSSMGLDRVLTGRSFSRLLVALHRRVDGVVVLTEEMAAEALAFGIPACRIRLLGNGIDAHAFRPVDEPARGDARSRLGLDGMQCALFVGRLSKEKNVSGLLDAWAAAKPQLNGAWCLILVGDGPLRAELAAKAASLGLATSVHFIGQQENVAAWLAAASVYVLSSENEGLCNSMLEAMATGLPLVVTRVSGTTELVERAGCGRVVPVDDMLALATALVELASSTELRRSMGINSRRVIEERFTIERVASAHRQLYAELVQRGSLR